MVEFNNTGIKLLLNTKVINRESKNIKIIYLYILFIALLVTILNVVKRVVLDHCSISVLFATLYFLFLYYSSMWFDGLKYLFNFQLIYRKFTVAEIWICQHHPKHATILTSLLHRSKMLCYYIKEWTEVFIATLDKL